MNVKLLLAGLFLILSTCSKDFDPNSVKKAAYGETYRVLVGKSIADPAKGTIIKFEKMLGDSRCPKGVQCVWEGKATIQISVTDKAGQINTYEVDNGKETTTDYGYKIIFVTLFPYPEKGKYIDPKEYQAELKLVKI